MALPSALPENILLLASAERDLERLCKRNRQEFLRVWEDVRRLGNGTLPPQGKKKLTSMDAYRFDSGRYRVVYSRRDTSYVMWAMFAKPEQKDYFKQFR